MTFMLKNKNHPAIKLSREEAEFLLVENDIPVSKLDAIQSFNESAQLPKGAFIHWSNNAGK